MAYLRSPTYSNKTQTRVVLLCTLLIPQRLLLKKAPLREKPETSSRVSKIHQLLVNEVGLDVYDGPEY
jgi:hypothetical protein